MWTKQDHHLETIYSAPVFWQSVKEAIDVFFNYYITVWNKDILGRIEHDKNILYVL